MLNIIKKSLIRALPILAIGLLVMAGLWLLEINKPEVETRANKVRKTKVFIQKTKQLSHRLQIHSQGEAKPKQQIQLKNQVEGRIVYVSPTFVAGGRFNQGDVLAAIDNSDYQLAVIQRKSRVAQAHQQWLKAKAQSQTARLELDELGRDNASELAKKLPQLAYAAAELEAAQAQLSQAKLLLARTQIIAPFDGIVRSENISIGQTVNRNATLATIFATDVMEIRLPLSGKQLNQLSLPLDYYAGTDTGRFGVKLTAQFGDKQGQWQGRVVRTESTIDPRTRTISVVVAVATPYKVDSPEQMPLIAGMFVTATISGNTIEKASILPRKALRTDNKVWLVDADDKLQISPVDVISTSNDNVVVLGLTNHSRVIISALAIPTPGMAVNAIVEQLPQLIKVSAGKLIPKTYQKKLNRGNSNNQGKKLGKNLRSGKLTGGNH